MRYNGVCTVNQGRVSDSLICIDTRMTRYVFCGATPQYTIVKHGRVQGSYPWLIAYGTDVT